MKGLFRFIFAGLFFAGWGLAALSLHVVRAPGDKIVIIPKDKLGVTDTYVDARSWQMTDLVTHPDLAKRIIESGKAEQFGYLTGNPEINGPDVESAIEAALRSAPAPKAHDAHEDKRMRAARSALDSVESHAKAANAWWELQKK